jgi:hypothetical protein
LGQHVDGTWTTFGSFLPDIHVYQSVGGVLSVLVWSRKSQESEWSCFLTTLPKSAFVLGVFGGRPCNAIFSGDIPAGTTKNIARLGNCFNTLRMGLSKVIKETMPRAKRVALRLFCLLWDS